MPKTALYRQLKQAADWAPPPVHPTCRALLLCRGRRWVRACSSPLQLAVPPHPRALPTRHAPARLLGAPPRTLAMSKVWPLHCKTPSRFLKGFCHTQACALLILRLLSESRCALEHMLAPWQPLQVLQMLVHLQLFKYRLGVHLQDGTHHTLLHQAQRNAQHRALASQKGVAELNLIRSLLLCSG